MALKASKFSQMAGRASESSTIEPSGKSAGRSASPTLFLLAASFIGTAARQIPFNVVHPATWFWVIPYVASMNVVGLNV